VSDNDINISGQNRTWSVGKEAICVNPLLSRISKCDLLHRVIHCIRPLLTLRSEASLTRVESIIISLMEYPTPQRFIIFSCVSGNLFSNISRPPSSWINAYDAP